MRRPFRPSSSARWLKCSASEALALVAPEQPENDAQRDGTFLHAAGEYILKHPEWMLDARDLVNDDEFAAFIEDHLGFGYDIHDFLQDEAIDAVNAYVEYVRRIPGDLMVEVEVSIDHIIPDTRGTCDALIVEERDGMRILHIVDAKFGRGVRVYARENSQLGIYGIGAANLVGGHFDEVWLHIVQPRLGHFDQWATSPDWLDDLTAGIRKAYDDHLTGCGEFNPGEDQCRWCPAAGTCGAYARWVYEKTALEFDTIQWPLRDVAALQPDEIAIRILPHLDAIEAWVANVRSQATKTAIDGVELPGWKLVESTTRRRWKDETGAAIHLLSQFDENKVYTKKLVSISAAKKLLGKAGKDALVQFTEKPKGSAVLARSDDKRPALNPKEASLAEFDTFSE